MSSAPRWLYLLVAIALPVVACAEAADTPRATREEIRDDGVVPVVLVHGYGGDAATMATVKARLERAGREVVAIDLPAFGVGDVEVSAEAVGDAVEATGAPVVDLVGFSAGGVVARAYVDSLDPEDRPRFVVTLGSPHHGAEIAAMVAAERDGACEGACEQLAPGSAFLADLNEPDETPDGPSYVSVWTAADRVVTPPESAVLEGAVNVRLQDVCPGSDDGHVDLVQDPLPLGLVVWAVEGKLREPPGPDACAKLRAAGAATRP